MSNLILHVHNVAWLGGVPAFIADFAAAFPELAHQSLYLKDGGEDKGAIQMMNDAGVNTAFCPEKLGPTILNQFDPALVILHNISGGNVVGPHPWHWLRQFPTISYHHSAVSPTIPCDHHVFVSQYLKSRYKGLLGNFIRNWDVIPPCIQAKKYAGVKPDYKAKVVGKIATPTNAAKYPFMLLGAARAAGGKLMMPGCRKYFGEAQDVVDVSPNWWSVPRYLARMSLFLYVNSPTMGPETWGRCVTEAMAAGLPVIGENRGGVAEQIIDGVNGYLVDPNDAGRIRMLVSELLNNPSKLESMGQAARTIDGIADIKVLRAKLAPIMLRLAVGGV